MTRLQLEDSVVDGVIRMSDGVPGALTVLMRLIKEGEQVDPANALGGVGLMLDMDTLGIYGSRIWTLYKDVCKENLNHTCAMLRAWQLGFVSDDKLNHAIDNYGEGIDVQGLCAQVKDRLPDFVLGD